MLLVSPSSSREDDGDDDDDDFGYGEKSQVACDGCTAPIHPHKSKYYSCVEGKYFLHSTCFRLPQTFTPHHPLHPNHTTPLKLQTCPKLDTIKCNICKFYTNGLFYSCAECDFKADVKCASLPSVIKHRAHSQPRHRLKLVESKDYTDSLHVRCIGCSNFLVRPGAIFYSCQSCEFILCCACVLLPASDDTCYLDQHVLPLAFNAAADHPGKFYCDECEREMNPKCWMYHCRHCDTSYHPSCIHTLSGYDRNFKYGKEFNIETLHGHPLRVQRLIRKFRCHVCGRKEKNDAGFQCASCDFFACGCNLLSTDDPLPLI
ncbi:uncharacterized protein LOC121808939 [Salvia splendens]|uniref:uncharacterized protein LOC121808939 n=1 Tax=Salvia splendens TaxID=180675 RepID=UPI001C27CE5B|nr:uncharacterized protein LOC121808939 [Salvia splendens]